MKTRIDTERQKEGITESHSTDMEELECESDQLKESIQSFRDSLRADAAKPEAFWTRQRIAIAGNPKRPSYALRLRPVFLWAPAFLAALVCFALFMEKNELPAPDFAAGADQNLLVEVEQALYRDCPEGLAPAAALIQEIK